MTQFEISQAQLALLWHTLGIRPESRYHREVSRNYFLTSPGYDDANNLDVLVDQGLMTRGKPPAFCDQNEVVFRANEEGQRLALKSMPPLPKQTNYEKFCEEDSGLYFHEYLNIAKPRFECRGEWRKREYRMYRQSRGYDSYRDVQGDWAPTMKAAKASYKEALKKNQKDNRAAA